MAARDEPDGTDAAADDERSAGADIDHGFAARLAAYSPPSSTPEDPGTTESAAPAVWRWPVALGGGLIGAGIATVFAAGWLVPRGLAHGVRAYMHWPARHHHWLSDHSLRVLTVALGGVLVVWALTAWYRRWVWVERSSFRVASPLLVAWAIVTTGWAVAAVRVELSTGFLGPRTVTAGVGALAVLVGALVVLVTGRRRGTVGVRRALLATTAAAVVVVVAATVGAVGAPGYGLVATVAPVAGTPAVPATVSRVAWSRAMPSEVVDVVPAGPGVLVLLEDGVVAVDGLTGRIRWTYRRPGASVEHLSVSPGGRSALLHWGPDRSQLVALDATTGRVRYINGGAKEFGQIPMTDDLWLSSSPGAEGRPTVDAWSLRDGHHLWRYRPAEDCRLDYVRNVWRQTRAAVIFPIMCYRHASDAVRFVHFVAYGTSATPLWQRRVPLPGHSPEVYGIDAEAAADGSWYGAEISLGRKSLTVAFDPRTGRSRSYRRHALSGTRWVRSDGDRGIVVHDADGGAWPVPKAPCSFDDRTIFSAAAPGATGFYADDGWTFAAGAVGCLSASDANGARGTEVVQVQDLPSGRRHQIPVDLGGPYQESSDLPRSSLTAAPGAWVVVSREHLAAGGVSRVVGLR
ncbi:hypothetical protein [Actinocatenispora sera]|uniref:Uncharacterized protein n=1 Tax=Actinocatenispora sera TaxID=390989 RepID=A0A810L122_9ACTN|nr:hypothetical protein [Actinocatenispora sera]BCJ28529.1 hypothetical protein Asera_26370 [Actinocatenispora sera]